MDNKLSYRNEDDKCYGATGMAVALVVLNGEDRLSAVALDAAPGEIMEMQSEFYFSGNPSLSAKTVWHTMKDNFALTVGMLISNIMCRRIVLDSETVDNDLRSQIFSVINEEGKEACGLEDDELDTLFDKEYRYLLRVFNHRAVQSVAHDFANQLKRRRHLSRLEVLEELRALANL